MAVVNDGVVNKEKSWGSISLSISDSRNDEYNQSMDVSKELYYDSEDDCISIELFRDFVIGCAHMFGWGPKTIEDYFGEW